MAIWSDLATWVGPTPNHSGKISKYLYVVLHIADGTYAGTIAWQKNDASNVSSHFIVAKDGRIAQMVDTRDQTWTQIQGNPYSVSVENEGVSGESLTPQQVQACARILERAHREHGIPLQLTSVVGTPGLAHHSMGYESGVNWGHQFCPGPAIKAQKPAILAAAQQLAGGTTMAFLDDENAAKLAYRIDALAAGSDTIRGGPEKGQPMEAMKRLNLIGQQVGSPVDVAALAAALAPSLAADVAAVLVPSLTTMVEQAVADVLTKGTDAIQH